MFPIEIEPLQAAVSAVGYTESRVCGVATVDPQPVGEVEFPVIFTGLADGR